MAESEYLIGYYRKAGGEMPVVTYIRNKSVEEQGKICRKRDLLKKEGPFLKFPSTRKISKIYELRPEGMRLFYYWKKRTAVFVHAVDKKDFSQSDIALSEQRRKELEG